MPVITIRFTESAVADLEEIKRGYAVQDVPDVGDRLISEIIERVETLRDHPDIERVVLEFDQQFLRELIHPPYRIVCRREPKQLLITQCAV